MSYRFNTSFFSWFFVIFMPFALALLLWQGISLVFPTPELEGKTQKINNKKFTLQLSGLFVAESHEKHPLSKKQINKTELKSFILKALYGEGIGSFVILNYQEESHFVSLNETFNGYTLIRVASQDATFERNGKFYTLSINPDQKLKAIPTQLERTKENYILSRKEIEGLGQNIRSIWDDIHLESDKVSNPKKGFRVSFIKSDTLFERMGLKKGDYLQRVNGVEIKDKQKMMNIYLSLSSLTTIHLSIVRNMLPKDLYYEIR